MSRDILRRMLLLFKKLHVQYYIEFFVIKIEGLRGQIVFDKVVQRVNLDKQCYIISKDVLLENIDKQVAFRSM